MNLEMKNDEAKIATTNVYDLYLKYVLSSLRHHVTSSPLTTSNQIHSKFRCSICLPLTLLSPEHKLAALSFGQDAGDEKRSAAIAAACSKRGVFSVATCL